MRMKIRVDKYLKLPEYKRQRMAVEWCLRFLKINLDRMTRRDFVELVTKYESIVMYPSRRHVRWRFQDDDAAKTAFKGYQKIAQEFIRKIKELSPDKPIHVKVPKRVSISSAPDGRIKINPSGRQGFKFSYTHHIARLLDGKKYDDAVKSCRNCDLLFPVLTKHKKTFCSTGCATKYRQRKKREENPERARRIRKLQTQFSRLNKKFPNEARRHKELMKYIKKNAYDKSEIPEKIRTFIEVKD